MDGFGAKFAVTLGAILTAIEGDIILLYESFLQSEIMRNSMLQHINLLAGKDLIDEEKDETKKNLGTQKLGEELDKINLAIESINKSLLESWKFKRRILSLDKSRIINLYKKRFYQKWSNDESLKLANENFNLEITSEIKKSLSSIREFLEQFETSEIFAGYGDIRMPHKKDVQEAIHINSIGYGRTAILCIGRSIEDLINKYLLKLFEKSKISKEEYDRKVGLNYSNKIGFLKGKFLTEEEFADLNSFSFKRNKGGHPNLGDIDNDKARTLLEQGIWLIIELQKKIETVEKGVNIEQDKSRELLGGRSIHSSFLTGKSTE